VDEVTLRSLVARGEGEQLEFKRGTTDFSDLAEAVVCLANHHGGWVLVGVDDRGTISGCDHDVGVLKRAIFDSTQPPLTVDVEEVELPEGRVLCVRVPETAWVVATARGRYLRRSGTDCLPVPPTALLEMMVARGQMDLSRLTIRNARLEDLDLAQLALLRELLRVRGRAADLVGLRDLDLMVTLGLVEQAGDTVHPTVTGLMALGYPATLTRFLPQWEIKYLHFDASGKPDVRESIHLPLVPALRRLEELIELRNSRISVPVGMARAEIAEFPPEVYREAVLNALCHRDLGRVEPIYVYHHPDRLTVSSPGGLPGDITPDNIIRHRAYHRNPTLALLVERLGYVERAGIGVDMMFRVCLEQGKEPPEIRATPDSVEVTLRNGKVAESFVRFVQRRVEQGRSLTLDELLVLNHFRRHPEIDRGETAHVCQCSEREAAEILDSMVNRGLLVRLGRTRGSTYRLHSAVIEVLGDWAARPVRHSPYPEEAALRLVADRGFLTAGDCRHVLRLTPAQTRRFLRALVERGWLERRGTGRATRYVRGPVAPEL